MENAPLGIAQAEFSVAIFFKGMRVSAASGNAPPG